MNKPNIFDQALQCIMQQDADIKCELSHALYQNVSMEFISFDKKSDVISITTPGLPLQVKLVAPRQLLNRALNTEQGHASLIHSICHIECNAINLAWDAVYRFRDMPKDYYRDWAKVASEEAKHFLLLQDHLNKLGYQYGDFPAHNGLWEMAVQTDFDPLVRMALVPRALEARGLDVTPGIIRKLNSIGDTSATKILDIIFHDEIEHVAIGTRWFNYLCDERNQNRQQTFETLFNKYLAGRFKGSIHRDARLQAGFTESELNYLEGAG